MPGKSVPVGSVVGRAGRLNHVTNGLTIVELHAVPTMVAELRRDPQPKVSIDTEVPAIVQAGDVGAKQEPVGDGMLTALCERPYVCRLEAREGCTPCDGTPVLIRSGKRHA